MLSNLCLSITVLSYAGLMVLIHTGGCRRFDEWIDPASRISWTGSKVKLKKSRKIDKKREKEREKERDRWDKERDRRNPRAKKGYAKRLIKSREKESDGKKISRKWANRRKEIEFQRIKRTLQFFFLSAICSTKNHYVSVHVCLHFT